MALISSKYVSLVVSGGRTGTQFVGERLGDFIEDATSIHEPESTPSTFPTPQRLAAFGPYNAIFPLFLGKLIGRTGARNISRRYLEGRIDGSEAARQLAGLRRRYYETRQTSLVIESNHGLFGLMDVIPRVLARYKVIVIVRDPRKWVQSCTQKGRIYDWNDWLTALGIGRITPRGLDDRAFAARWKSMTLFERIAWNWRTTYQILRTASQGDPNVLWFKFEDLFEGPDRYAEFDRLLRFVTHFEERRFAYDLPPNALNTPLNRSRPDPELDWRNWSTGQCRRLAQICSPLMQELGYGQEPEWQRRCGAAR